MYDILDVMKIAESANLDPTITEMKEVLNLIDAGEHDKITSELIEEVIANRPTVLPEESVRELCLYTEEEERKHYELWCFEQFGEETPSLELKDLHKDHIYYHIINLKNSL